MATNNAVNNAPNANLAQHSVPVVGAAGLLSSIGPLTNGQLCIGSTSNAPVAGNLTSTGGSIAITNGAGTINLETTGGQGITRIVRQVITSSGTYTPTAGMLYADVELIGGGGGGGGSAAPGPNVFSFSGGGAAGGYCKKLYTAAAIGASVSITIGSGGAGGAAGGTIGNVGTPGGNSSFLGLLAYGGEGGNISGTGSPTGAPTVAGSAYGSTGGNATGGDINIYGADGGWGTWCRGSDGWMGGASGFGAGSFYGGIVQSSHYAPGKDNAPYGSGGGGASSNQSSSGNIGGSGSDGVCIITEYCY